MWLTLYYHLRLGYLSIAEYSHGLDELDGLEGIVKQCDIANGLCLRCSVDNHSNTIPSAQKIFRKES